MIQIKIGIRELAAQSIDELHAAFGARCWPEFHYNLASQSLNVAIVMRLWKVHQVKTISLCILSLLMTAALSDSKYKRVQTT